MKINKVVVSLLFVASLLFSAMLGLSGPVSATPVTFPGPVAVDDTGVTVTPSSINVASVTDLDGNAVASPGAVGHVAGPNTSVVYDAAAKGEAWVTLTPVLSGHTFVNNPPRIFCSSDSSTLLSTNKGVVLGVGSVTSATTATATSFSTTLTSSTELIAGDGLVWITGQNTGKVNHISANSSGLFTLAGTGTPITPSTGDQFELLPFNKALVLYLAALGTDNKPLLSSSDTQAATEILATPSNKLATASGGGVTVATNSDKTGYSGTATNFVAAPTLAQIQGGLPTDSSIQSDTQTGAYNALNQAPPGSPTANSIFASEASDLTSSAAAATYLANLITGTGANTQFTTKALSLSPTGGSAPTVSQIAAAILANPSNLLNTDATGKVGVNNFPSTVALSSADETAIGGLAANFSSITGNFSNLPANVWAYSGGSGRSSSVSGYQTGFDPATYLLTTPANKIGTNSSGQIAASNLPADYLNATEIARLLAASTAQQAGSVVTLPANAPSTFLVNDTTVQGIGTTVSSNNTTVTAISTLLGNLTQGSGGTLQFKANALALSPSGSVPPTVSQIAAGILANPSNLIATNSSGQITVGAYGNGQDPATLLSSSLAALPAAFWGATGGDGQTYKQQLAILTAILARNFSINYVASTRTQTTVYYKVDGVTPLATSVTISDTTGRNVSKTVTFSNLP